MRRFLIPLVVLLLPGTLLAMQAARPPSSQERPRHVFIEREAFVLLVPEVVAGPAVEWAEWSSDSRYVLAQREFVRALPFPGQEPDGDVSLVLWNARTRRSVEVLKRPLKDTNIEQKGWLPGSGVAFIVYSWAQKVGTNVVPQRALLRVDAAGSRVGAIAQLASEDQLLTSPSRPLAALLRQDGRVATAADGKRRYVPFCSLRTLRPDGVIGQPVALPEGVSVTDRYWSTDGRLLYLRTGQRRERGQPPVEGWASFDPRAGRVAAIDKEPERYQPRPPAWPYRLRQSVVVGREAGQPVGVRPLWLESPVKSDAPRALVSADCDWAIPAPDASAILYGSEGTALVVPVQRLPKQTVLAAIQEAQQQTTMSNAKQLGLAMMMYVQDYDERFPPPDLSVKDVLLPYVKNTRVFTNPATNQDAYTFQFEAPTLKGIAKPAESVLGYVTGPGGRAVIYVDGHVKWEPE